MPTSRSATARVDAAARALVRAAGRARAPLVLAVSGGCDSMVMLDAVHRATSARRRGRASGAPMVSVLTFDHGTGPAAAAATVLVNARAADLGFAVRVGRGQTARATEAGWRAARWAFVRAAAPPGAIIATAHTRDDHVETVVMRILRDAGARGLAGLTATATDVARPMLGVTRADVRAYASARGIAFVEDPSNGSRRHLRNRIRHDLLPAIRAHRPRFEDDILELAMRASRLRAQVEEFVERFVSSAGQDGPVLVARQELATYDSEVLRVLWPAIAARAGVTLDRRGTLRLAQFTTSGAPGARIQLSGGVEVVRYRNAAGDGFVFRRSLKPSQSAARVMLTGVVEFGPWRFRPTPPSLGIKEQTLQPRTTPALWSADLPADRQLCVREWRPGDRMKAGKGGAARRVKRFFGDARVPGATRAGWPVVLADDEIVWIPGIRRVPAAPERSGRPMVRYTCERCDGGFPNA